MKKMYVTYLSRFSKIDSKVNQIIRGQVFGSQCFDSTSICFLWNLLKYCATSFHVVPFPGRMVSTPQSWGVRQQFSLALVVITVMWFLSSWFDFTRCWESCKWSTLPLSVGSWKAQIQVASLSFKGYRV